ncbi:shikimate dehydrogenase [Sporomusa acidovorans]|uniref:Shikimate dehydrogenase (NADP(+)) n=1 Tax=Sporomusa acidovorans (strain ATCC 49682 / DSM 3132 / Mol) TaxID=1123286 RepID=A0ABZ3J0X1_SPOA4|nr:shikimate dehydrogenase [Sporomusa acidovorans]OZC15017.1 quinate/shikimate dehydrogenase [Sporomusa acidovorans DSM 3132]SDE84114.1 shikimate dehydrogenase [Sporomusa acidovorans]
MMITAKTQKVGLLGWPLGHSLSPVMQNAAFAASNLDYVYLPLPTPPELLPQAVQGLKALGFAGVNVTIPHKVAIMEYLDEIDSSAKSVGAVNTILCQGDRLIGHNTDAGGYIRSLKQVGISVTGRSAVIFGAGGAARAVIAGFAAAHVAAITVGARDKNKAEHMAHLFDGTIPVSGVCWDSDEFAAALSNADIVVNATPLGMYPSTVNQPPVRWDLLQQSAVISDLIYNPLITGFMAEGIRRGHIVVGGEGMLLEQGALAFELWTGRKAPASVMRQALMRELKR